MSASSAATQTAATILLYQTTRVYNICGIAAIALFLYDYALCLDREYNFVWRSGKSKASTRLLYLLNRYTHLSSCILELVIIPPVLNVSCTVIIWTLTCAELLELIGTAMLTTIRTYVLSGQNKPLGAIAFILSLGPFLVNTSATYQFLPINLPPPQNCVQASTGSVLLNLGWTICSRTTAILADLITIIVTWRATRKSHQGLGDGFQRRSLEHVMWTNGSVYFFTLLFINILDLILVTLSITTPNDQGNFVALFLQPAASILNCHFLLDLYEANARLECGGSSLSPSYSDLSLHFTGIQAQAGDAPENSSFLTSFAGSIRHPFPDSADPDTDLITDEPPAMPLVPVQTAGRPVSPGVAT